VEELHSKEKTREERKKRSAKRGMRTSEALMQLVRTLDLRAVLKAGGGKRAFLDSAHRKGTRRTEECAL